MPVYVDEAQVLPLLARMRLPRPALLEIARKVGGERANVGPHEPSNVVGFETWRWGTRFKREDPSLKALGWRLCDGDQVAGIRNPDVGIKLVFCSTNANTGNPNKHPKNLSDRGPASCKLIGRNSGQFEMHFGEDEELDDLWYYCQHISEQHIALEISRPSAVYSGVVTDFSDRIIIAKPGEIPGIRRPKVEEDFAEVPKPQVTRKTG